jgi:photosystem II stability/assembly factor-like uncharacterized protein
MKQILLFSTIFIFLGFSSLLFCQNLDIQRDNLGNTPRSLLNPGLKGLLPEQRGGNPWTSLGPFGGDVYDLAVDPVNPDTIYAAAGFPFRSVDGGTTWQVMESLSALAQAGISSIEVNSNGVVFACGSNIFQKIFRSVDYGETWIGKTLPVNTSGLDIAIDPGDPNTVYIGLTSILGSSANNVVVKSTNAGDTWTSYNLISVLPVGYSVIDIVIDPANSQALFAIGAEGFSNGKVAATLDGGATWVDRTGNLPTGKPYNSLTFSGQNLFLAGGQLFGGQVLGVYKTTDYGISWQEISGSFPNQISNAILIDPADPDKMYVATEGDGIYYTENGGTSWIYTSSGAGDNGAARCLAFDPGNTEVIYAGFLSLAICKSINGGQAWEYANNGIATLLTNDIEVDVNDPLKILVGFEAENSGGCYLSNDGGSTWSLVAGLPGTRFSQVTFGSDGAMYAWSNGPTSVAQEGLYKSIDGGTTWNNMGPNVGGLFETQIFGLTASDTDPGLIFICGNNFGVNGWASVIHRSTDGGANWDNVYIGPDNDSFKFMFIGPNSNDQTVYTAFAANSGQGGFMKSTDEGSNWQFINTGLPTVARWGGAIVCNPVNPEILYGGLGGYGDMNAKIFKSFDGGSSWSPTNITLASYSKFSDILVSPGDTNVVYAATTLNGAYISMNAGLSWETANSGLPATNVSGFSHAFMKNNTWKLCASTFSNSTFITDVYDVSTSVNNLSDPGSHMKVFPNPGNGSCRLSLLANKNVDVNIAVFNSLGQLIRTIASGKLEKGNYQFLFSAKPGIYYLHTNLEGIVETEKIVLY